jgi:hypothetical protein
MRSIEPITAFLGTLALTGGAATASPPDLSGTWSLPFQVHSSGVPLSSGATDWIPISKGDPKNVKILSIAELGARMDQSVKEHNGNPLFGFPTPAKAPLNAAGEAAAAKLDPKKAEERELACYPMNVFARVGGGGSTVEIIQGSRSIAMLADGGGPGRIVYLDGRHDEKRPPQWNGHSTGHWDRSTLKVVTTGIRGDSVGFGFGQGWPLSERAQLLEEYTLIHEGKQLQVLATFEDPIYYKEPMRKIMYLDRHPELEVTDYTCDEGKDDMIETVVKDGGKS